MIKTASVIGLGKLGSPMAAAIAARGLHVIVTDADPRKVEAIRNGQPPVNEPQLAELIRESGSRLEATEDIQGAVQRSEVTFIVVGTPSEATGGFSLRYALPACEEIGRALREKSAFHLVVLTSTVMPGSTGGELKAELERASGKICGKDFGLCYSPEFIALGTVIRDFYHPDFVLIGESDPRSGDILEGIYGQVCKNSPRVARMNFVNAEITKLAVNTYVTMKISYANMLARICEGLPQADVSVVTGALGMDTRIGSKYLKGAVSYGGPCFPRDNRAMVALAATVHASSDLAEATDRFNRAQIKSLAALVKQHHSGKGAIGILGLTYKPNTEVVEESFGLLMAQELGASHFPVVVFDPAADARKVLGAYQTIRIGDSAADCIEKSDLVLLATPWQQFLDIPAEQWIGRARPLVVVDCWRALAHLQGVDGIRYVRLGFGESAQKPAEAGAEVEQPVHAGGARVALGPNSA